MPVKIAVLKETRANERRVALVPVVADKLTKLGARNMVWKESKQDKE